MGMDRGRYSNWLLPSLCTYAGRHACTHTHTDTRTQKVQVETHSATEPLQLRKPYQNLKEVTLKIKPFEGQQSMEKYTMP